ncbi:MAG: S1C family serine protease, partial [Pseudomonadales bacterium]
EYATGVVVDRNGLILTNYHTLGDALRNDYVVWVSGKAYSNVGVKAADPWSDLAVLEIDAKDLKPIVLGDATELKKGRIVIALGNPHAIARDGHASATWGIVSNLRRKVDGPLEGGEGPNSVALSDRETRYHYGALIQTDARLARGSSGGPLLDLADRTRPPSQKRSQRSDGMFWLRHLDSMPQEIWRAVTRRSPKE